MTQADRLDELVKSKPKKVSDVKFISVTSGKGGVGKSTLSANLAYTLWKMNFKVCIMDADIGLANLDVIFGVKADKNILHVLKGAASMQDVLVKIEDGLFLLPGDSGEEMLKYSADFMMDSFLAQVDLIPEFDFVIIDTGAGIGDHIKAFLNASDEVIVITAPDPSAITDAYATIKISAKSRNRILMVLNMVKNGTEAKTIFEKLKTVAKKNIGDELKLELIGKINQDPNVSKCTKSRSLFVKIFPDSESTIDLENIAKILAKKLERNVLENGESRGFSRFFRKMLSQF